MDKASAESVAEHLIIAFLRLEVDFTFGFNNEGLFGLVFVVASSMSSEGTTERRTARGLHWLATLWPLLRENNILLRPWNALQVCDCRAATQIHDSAEPNKVLIVVWFVA